MKKECLIDEIKELKADMKRNLFILENMQIKNEWYNTNVRTWIRQLIFLEREVTKDD